MVAARRWPVISALGIVQILAWGSSYYLMPVLALPIVTDTGWPLPWVVRHSRLGLLVGDWRRHLSGAGSPGMVGARCWRPDAPC